MTAINFSNALGIHEQALGWRVKRAEVIASNLANADTPGYKARDLDFAKALQAATGAPGPDLRLAKTHRGHLSLGQGANGDRAMNMPTLVRENMQTSLDGNTVDTQKESMEFARNAMEFSLSFRLLNSRFNGMSKAIKGE